MSWLRLDDGYASHPKIAGLSDREFRVWTRLLLYCARYKTQGRIDAEAATTELPGLTPKLIDKFTERGLIDKTENGSTTPILAVHDWAAYNERQSCDYTATERKQRQRNRDKNRDGHRDLPVTETVTRALARACVPVPSPSLSQSSSAVRDPAAAASGLLEELAETVRWDPPKLVAARADEPRAVAWLQASLTRDDIRNPGGWAWAGLRSGDWPSERKETEDVKGQNLAGKEIDHADVVDYCAGCQEPYPLSVLDLKHGFCPGCEVPVSEEAA